MIQLISHWGAHLLIARKGQKEWLKNKEGKRERTSDCESWILTNSLSIFHRYLLWALEKFRQGLDPKDYAIEPKPKKKVRGWGPRVQNGIRVSGRKRPGEKWKGVNHVISFCTLESIHNRSVFCLFMCLSLILMRKERVTGDFPATTSFFERCLG